jgi:hypothetical protein
MGNHYIFIFVAWDCVEAAWWYFFCVETQGRTLEVSTAEDECRLIRSHSLTILNLFQQ